MKSFLHLPPKAHSNNANKCSNDSSLALRFFLLSSCLSNYYQNSKPDDEQTKAISCPLFNDRLQFVSRTMIAYLAGRVLEKNTNSVIIEVGGVGYEVIVPLTTFYKLGEVGSKVSLRIYTHVREDTLQLYGFMTEIEKQLFLKLIAVQGISTKSALSILSSMNADEVVQAILSKDIVKLTTIPGVGRKIAERLTVELKDKLRDFELAESTSYGFKSEKTPDAKALSVYQDALSALINLGYQRSVAETALKNVLSENPEIELTELIRRGLQTLSKVRG
ncbi:MAG: Holliday junction branch migration protein RuvA [Acidobacteria bacterium]|nr:MAG: Holliday junction branch migration protein RuvA [Acidobacteriota bacterium]